MSVAQKCRQQPAFPEQLPCLAYLLTFLHMLCSHNHSILQPFSWLYNIFQSCYVLSLISLVPQIFGLCKIFAIPSCASPHRDCPESGKTSG